MGIEHVSRRTRWTAVLFVVGSCCFLVGPLPVFLDLVGAQVDALVFFVGSLLFTAAATLQWLETRRHRRVEQRGCSWPARCSSTPPPSGP